MARPQEEGDSIHLTALQLPHGVLAPDIWGEPQLKPTPATISVEMTLRSPGFKSAAQGDALDRSTLHYGHLAKRLRSELETAEEIDTVLILGVMVLDEMNKATSNQTISREPSGPLDRARVSVEVEKGGMFAESVQVFRDARFSGTTRPEVTGNGIHIRDVSMKVLIGVNDYERQKPQLVYGSIEFYYEISEGRKVGRDFSEQLFHLERKLLSIVEHTRFETLESLAEHAIHQLGTRTVIASTPGAWVKVRLAKPRAVAFANAPAVEVCRKFPLGTSSRSSEQRGGFAPPGLVTIKPYNQ